MFVGPWSFYLHRINSDMTDPSIIMITEKILMFTFWKIINYVFLVVVFI